MKEYTIGKKAAVIVIHQLFIILMVTCVYATDYCMHNKIRDYAGNYGLISIISLAGSFIALAYLTNITGRKSDDDPTIYYWPIDKVHSDVLFICFLLIMFGISFLIKKVRLADFNFSSLMIVSGTITYILDASFLTFYNSIIRKIKGNILITHSILFILYELIVEFIDKKHLNQCTRNAKERYEIQCAIEKIAAGAIDTTLDVDNFHGQQRSIAEAVNHIQEGLSKAVKESIKNERMKADLITNVSHDIKTPLTSIVNYVDLLKRENLDNEKANNYIRIIDEKSQRLKQLTEDLVEASKISSGNVKLDIQKIDLVELLYQTGGEFNERFEQRDLTIVTKLPDESIFIEADGRQLYRAIENLYTNAAKYALEKTRVYVELAKENGNAVFKIKNISKVEIQYQQGEYQNLTDRFVRGEASRTTEGSGLGLSIAKNLTVLMGGNFDIKIDGDLFIATITFKIA